MGARTVPARKVVRDIETLQESLRNDWKDLAALNLSPAERGEVRRHMELCIVQLNYLIGQLEAMDQA